MRRLLLIPFGILVALYRAISVAIRQDARALGASVIDLHADVAALCATRDCAGLFFVDGHPTAEGYAVVARTVADELR